MNEGVIIERLEKRKSLECVFCHYALPNIASVVKYDYCFNGMNHTNISNYIYNRNNDRRQNRITDEEASEASENFIIIEYINCPQCQKNFYNCLSPIFRISYSYLSTKQRENISGIHSKTNSSGLRRSLLDCRIKPQSLGDTVKKMLTGNDQRLFRNYKK